jgi:hypothetical protein
VALPTGLVAGATGHISWHNTLHGASNTRATPVVADGLKGWAYDPATGPRNGAASQGTGKILVVKVELAAAATITNIIVDVFTGGSTLTTNQNLAAVYLATGSKVTSSETADQSTAWTTTGIKTMALAGGPVTVDPGAAVWVWVALLTVGTTPPLFRRGNNDAAVSNVGTSASTRRFALDASTGNTSMPSSLTPGTMTTFEGAWAALS